jgi:hypothetical protein
MSTHAQIQELVDTGRRKEAERLLLASQTPATPYELNSAKGLAAIRKGAYE